jgi:hypothetical protein
MAKVVGPIFPEGIGCLEYKPQKNLKGYDYVVSVRKMRKRKVVGK